MVTQNGLPFALGRRAGGWFGAERGSFEFMIKPGKGGLQVDLGAGRVLTFKKLGKRKAVPAGDRRHLQLARHRRDLARAPRRRGLHDRRLRPAGHRRRSRGP